MDHFSEYKDIAHVCRTLDKGYGDRLPNESGEDRKYRVMSNTLFVLSHYADVVFDIETPGVNEELVEKLREGIRHHHFEVFTSAPYDEQTSPRLRDIVREEKEAFGASNRDFSAQDYLSL